LREPVEGPAKRGDEGHTATAQAGDAIVVLGCRSAAGLRRRLDRGVSLFRRQLRRGIRATRAGRDPDGLCREAGGVVSTYCNDTIVRLPPAGSEALDKKLMRETGHRLAEGYLKEPPLTNGRVRADRPTPAPEARA